MDILEELLEQLVWGSVEETVLHSLSRIILDWVSYNNSRWVWITPKMTDDLKKHLKGPTTWGRVIQWVTPGMMNGRGLDKADDTRAETGSQVQELFTKITAYQMVIIYRNHFEEGG